MCLVAAFLEAAGLVLSSRSRRAKQGRSALRTADDATTRHGILKDVPMGSLTADELAAAQVPPGGGLALKMEKFMSWVGPHGLKSHMAELRVEMCRKR